MKPIYLRLSCLLLPLLACAFWLGAFGRPNDPALGAPPTAPSVQPAAPGGPLMLTPEERSLQTAGGTWRELFPAEGPGQRAPILVWVALAAFVIILVGIWPVMRLTKIAEAQPKPRPAFHAT